MSTAARGPFNARLVIAVVVAALIGFVAYLFLLTYAPDLDAGRDGEAHALSPSAVGYQAFVDLETKLGSAPEIVRDEAGLATDNLLILTPDIRTTSADDLAKIVNDRGDKPTLIVVPGYYVAPVAALGKRGWVYSTGGPSPAALKTIFSKITDLTFAQSTMPVTAPLGISHAQVTIFGADYFKAGARVNTMSGDDLRPVLADDALDRGATSHIVLAQVRRDQNKNLYILAEPDLLNNMGLADPVRAYAATQLIDRLRRVEGPSAGDDLLPISLDVTLNGFKSGGGLIDMALRPPFLALTLSLMAAAALALLGGLLRFGPPLRDARAIPRGKGALVANTAGLLKLARVEGRLGPCYAALVRDLAAQDIGLPSGMSSDLVTARLEKLSRSEPKFSQLAAGVSGVTDRGRLVDAARQLDTWRRTIVRGKMKQEDRA